MGGGAAPQEPNQPAALGCGEAGLAARVGPGSKTPQPAIARFHRLTEDAEAPTVRATSRAPPPDRSSIAARRLRRPSSAASPGGLMPRHYAKVTDCSIRSSKISN